MYLETNTKVYLEHLLKLVANFILSYLEIPGVFFDVQLWHVSDVSLNSSGAVWSHGVKPPVEPTTLEQQILDDPFYRNPSQEVILALTTRYLLLIVIISARGPSEIGWNDVPTTSTISCASRSDSEAVHHP